MVRLSANRNYLSLQRDKTKPKVVSRRSFPLISFAERSSERKGGKKTCPTRDGKRALAPKRRNSFDVIDRVRFHRAYWIIRAIQFCLDPTKSIRFQICFLSRFRDLISNVSISSRLKDSQLKKNLPGKTITFLNSSSKRLFPLRGEYCESAKRREVNLK